MKISNGVNKKISFPIAIIIIAVLAVLVGGIIAWQYFGVPTETELPEIGMPPDETAGTVLYKTGNDLVLYNPITKAKSIILNSANLLDFDLSRDKNFIAYSLKETGFEGNSDVYFKNLETGKITRLGQKNNIASFNPKILPDNSKVLYVRREYNPSTGRLSDGEIWIIDSNGDIESSKRLFIADKIKGLETEEYYASEEEKRSVKIGIDDISRDGKTLTYWKKDWGAGIGLFQYRYFSNLDGSDFLSEKFKQQNTFTFDTFDTSQKQLNWEPYEIFWFSNGDFIIGQTAPGPITGEAIYYYDKNHNKKWEIFDSFKQDAEKYDTQVFLDDIVKKDDNHFIVVYNAYKRLEDTKYFVEELTFGDKIYLANLNNKKYFAVDSDHQISNINILDDSNIVYIKQSGKNNFGLYLYNIFSGKEEEIIKSNSGIEFDL